jgi:hypothetical protein
VVVWANQDPEVQKGEAVDVAVAGSAQGSPLVEAAEECIPCKAAIG